MPLDVIDVEAGAVDLRLLLGIEVDELRVAAVLEVRDAVVVPAVLVVAQERARRVRRESCLARPRQAEQERRPVQAKLIVKESLNFLRASLPTTIEVRQDIQSDSTLLADPTHVHQILMNLCTNAGHAMLDKGGVLEVKLENIELDADFTAGHPDMKPGAYLNLTVCDTGLGMPTQVLKRIFDPYDHGT